jgi:hypothetical protein
MNSVSSQYHMVEPSSRHSLKLAAMQSLATSLPYSTYPPTPYLPGQSLIQDVTASSQQPLPLWTHAIETPTYSQNLWLPISPISPPGSQLNFSAYQQYDLLGSPINLGDAEKSFHHGPLKTTIVTTGLPSPTQSPRSSSAGTASTTSSPTGSVTSGHCRTPSSPGQDDLNLYGFVNAEGSWSCAYPGCTSRASFTRGCDLRKHHKRHTKSFFCRYPACSQASGGGFSSKKDLARHEAKHNPGVVCEWSGCDRIFSRVDNMVGRLRSCRGVHAANWAQRDHVKRIHLKSHRTMGARASVRASR